MDHGHHWRVPVAAVTWLRLAGIVGSALLVGCAARSEPSPAESPSIRPQTSSSSAQASGPKSAEPTSSVATYPVPAGSHPHDVAPAADGGVWYTAQASGELGWLTGPSTFIDRTDPKAPPHYGNYLSVWRRQPGGAWRVFIDVGVDAPEPVQFPPGLTRLPFGPRYTGPEEKTAPAASLLSADRALNDRIATAGAADAYAAVMTDASRLHRRGFMPSIGRSAAQKWMAQHATSMTASTGAADAARSADLGYSYGTYQVSGTKPENGAYVRVWTRDAAGKWFVVADVTQRIPNP